MHEAALAAHWDALLAAASLSAASLAGVRRLLTEALSYHGAGSAALWLLALRIEGSSAYTAAASAAATAAAGGGRRAPGATAADVYARAMRSLRGDAAQAFVEGAAHIRARL